MSIFVKTVLLPVFAIVLVSSISAYVQFFVLASDIVLTDAVNITKENSKDVKEIFAKILAMINITVVGFTISRLIPIVLNKRKRSELERED
ncbi:MAG: hypothetical protein OEM28_11140 [Nitrosopumilus sp.]|nr:hypothetical protein [Nitrosopumilus sp.]MDH3486575.1 hypothetical protein [Nitrosopumilus sp.]